MTLLRTTWTDDDGSGTTGSMLNAAALAAIWDKLGLSMASIIGGRLTLTSGTAVTTADVSAATNIFYTPHVSSAIALYDGVSAWNVLSFSETTLALGTLSSGLPYDVFAYNNSGTLGLRSPVAWTNTTTRATALVKQDGVWVKSGATTDRYLGTFYTTSTTTTEDSFAKRFVWNAANRVPRVLKAVDTTDSWPYTLATFRQANANTANQLDVVIGLAEVELTAEVRAEAANSGAVNTSAFTVAIGEDSTTTPATGCLRSLPNNPAANTRVTLGASLRLFPAVGRHFYTWLEYSVAAGVTTWSGDLAGTIEQSGIIGSIQG